MAFNQLTVLNDLPRFTGNPRPGEPSFKMEIDARTFMRTVENYFASHSVSSDERKLNILFSLIDKKKGDAIRLLTCYAGKAVAFEEVKTQFLNMYPSFKATEFQHAAKAMLETNLKLNNVFCGMTSLENTSRAAAEAYLNHEALTKGNFNIKTVLQKAGNTNVAQPVPTAPPATTPTADTSASAATTTAASTGSIAPPISPATSASSATTSILLVDVLQNYSMHLFVATQTHNKVYEKLNAKGPQISSTQFMSDTVKAVEKHKLLYPTKKPERSDDVIWQVNKRPDNPGWAKQRPAQQNRNMQQQNQSAQPPRNNVAPTTRPQPAADRSGAELKCFNCGARGHTRRECRTCSYCKKYGHTAKKCAERIAKARGKYCHECKISDSHDTKDCYKTARSSRTRNNANVRLAREETTSDTSEEDAWASEIYEAIHEEGGEFSDDQY